MHTHARGLLALYAAALTVVAQPAARPATFDRTETIEGSITSVNLAPGGMPSIGVKTKEGARRVRLGSIRYLIAENFNPKAGQAVIVRGFAQESGELVAISVECPQTGQKLTLREEDGTPLWRGGAHRQGARKQAPEKR